MKKYLVGFYYSLPVQLFLLHFRKYQVLLVFWYILFGTVNTSFLKAYGANSLYLAPEYLGSVNALSTGMVGFSIGIFIMSWNITTFILLAKHVKFLATTTNPFLKFCINNAIIPFLFLLFYLVKAYHFNKYQQLISISDITVLSIGFIVGLALSILIAFFYFFSADKTIYRRVASIIDTANMKYSLLPKDMVAENHSGEIRVDWFLSAKFKLRKPRDVRHYSQSFLDTIFNRHHLAAVVSIIVAIISLLCMGFFLDHRVFQIPAGASSTLLFAVLIAAAGAFSHFFRNWSILFLIAIFVTLNLLIEYNVIDTRNKAYGLNYSEDNARPIYSKENINALASDSNALVDKEYFTTILENWKARQPTEKPVMYFVNVSGGGNRSATFTLNVLQHLDSITKGNFMKQVFLISGSSGGMLGAAYFRELYHQKVSGETINLHDDRYLENVSKDLLNPLFTSFVARDIIAPVQRFKVGKYSYVKDRGYAFERQLNINTGGILDKKLKDYIEAERLSKIPLIFYNSVITRDGRKMLISTHPARFMMKPRTDSISIIDPDPDLVDFVSLFKEQDPYNLRMLSALRMNATFPYVLPNVWLPSYPVIDVMDAGLRDNYGIETSMRFINVFREWLKENTSKIVVVQIRDRRLNDWEKPNEEVTALSWLIKPMVLLQNNWFKIQDYYQADEFSYLNSTDAGWINRMTFQYIPSKKEASATLSFHLTNAEKKDIKYALKDSSNQTLFAMLKQLSEVPVKREDPLKN